MTTRRRSNVRQSGNSLVLTIPAPVVIELGLKDGDFVFWRSEGADRLCLDVVKLDDIQPEISIDESAAGPAEAAAPPSPLSRPTLTLVPGGAAPPTDPPLELTRNGQFVRGRFHDDWIIELLVENPKRGKSRDRFACYENGITVREYVRRCEAAGYSAQKAHDDLRWDTAHGFIAVRPPRAEPQTA